MAAKKSPRKESVAGQQGGRETATFSVKIGADTLKMWRIYASMDGYGDKGRLTEQALTEYMDRHKLSPEKQAKFEALCKL